MAGGIFGAVTGFIKSTTSMAPAMEKMGAKFSKSFEKYSISSLNLADKMAEAGIPASVYDAFAFSLKANRLGLDSNNKALQDLFHATMATGEDFGRLTEGLFGATVGMKNTAKGMGKLHTAVEGAGRAFNMSREELVAALNSLSRDILNLVAVTGTGNTAIQETVVALQGLITDKRLAQQAIDIFQRKFDMKDMAKTLAIGFPVNDMMSANASMARGIQTMLDMGDRARRLLGIQNRANRRAFAGLGDKVTDATAMSKNQGDDARATGAALKKAVIGGTAVGADQGLKLAQQIKDGTGAAKWAANSANGVATKNANAIKKTVAGVTQAGDKASMNSGKILKKINSGVGSLNDETKRGDARAKVEGFNLIAHLDALETGFGDIKGMIAVANQILERAKFHNIDVVGKTNKQISNEIAKLIDQREKQDKRVMETLEMLKREIVRPLLNQMMLAFKEIKSVFKNEAFQNLIKQVLVGLGKLMYVAVVGFAEVVTALSTWLNLSAPFVQDIGQLSVDMADLVGLIEKTEKNTDSIDKTLKIDKENKDMDMNTLNNSFLKNSNFQIRQLVMVNRSLAESLKLQREANRKKIPPVIVKTATDEKLSSNTSVKEQTLGGN